VTSMPVDGLQQVHSDRGHLLDNGSQRVVYSCVSCVVVAMAIRTGEGRVGRGQQRHRWWEALNTKLLF
jgi:hypothetical protein